MAVRLSYAQMYDAVRAQYVGKRHWIEICADPKNREKRDELWFIEQRGALDAISQVGAEMRIMAANAESYDAWKATLRLPMEAHA